MYEFKRSRPDLRIRGELEPSSADGEDEILETAVLLTRDGEQSGVPVERRACRGLVAIERVSRDEGERRAGINDASGGR